ncbi:Two-component system sensor kinase [Corynebacterium pseudotuberculosis]|nr:Two-component system sensor kinase [Corynebacterium pseudotuberculosis]APQ55636.1 Two-component system sensor kinase [Corynebacterium pseudotuberculosis]ATB61367.1 Two-component system sensor kinase [Corynebacterium pseudotuberculosis]ATV79225.1 Two-component system sensor kinase [Corynebacterium pseudotuberculosis]AUY59861.1 Two-component system sensor kinase [Corynebacterium pseudotuberculosis]
MGNQKRCGKITGMQQAYPPFYRDRDNNVIGGVAAGLARYFGLSVLQVRIGLAALALLNGAGVMVYAALWIFTTSRSFRKESTILSGKTSETSAWAKPTNLLLAIAALAGAFGVSGFFGKSVGISSGVVAAFAVIGAGVLLAWLAYDRINSDYAVIMIGVGASLVFAGVLFAAVQWQDRQFFGSAVITVVLTLAGVAALVAPFVVRVVQKLNAGRVEKAAADERAEIAARIHDSVLQTLALIQKRSEDPEVRRLARGQERELRQWLFSPREDATVFKAIERACGEVEDMFAIMISPVIVGEDRPLEASTKSAVLAAREAMVNAAKHSGQDSADVYAECFDELAIFVRDRGPGFDLETVDESRHGVRDSILGRVKRAGGDVQIHNSAGTEVAIRMPFKKQ